MPNLSPEDVQDILQLAGNLNRDISEFQGKTDNASQNLQYRKVTPQAVLQGIQVKGKPLPTAPVAPAAPIAVMDGISIPPPRPFIPLDEAFAGRTPPSAPAGAPDFVVAPPTTPPPVPAQSVENINPNQMEFHFAHLPKSLQDAINKMVDNQGTTMLRLSQIEQKLCNIEKLLGEVLTKRKKRQEYANGTETEKLGS